jgi:multicomponent Na+:H+ antiporter subunit D
MLAYSTLAQIGFILVAIGWGSPLGLMAALVFTFNHSLIKSAMLMLAGAVASRAMVKSAAFSVLQGVGKSTPFGGVLFFLGALALAGIPPTNGFINKLLVFRSGVEGGQYLVLVLLIAGSVLTILYSGRAFMRIWWQTPGEDFKPKPGGDRLLAPALLVALVILLGIWPEALLKAAVLGVEWLQSPLAYIQAVLGN